MRKSVITSVAVIASLVSFVGFQTAKAGPIEEPIYTVQNSSAAPLPPAGDNISYVPGTGLTIGTSTGQLSTEPATVSKAPIASLTYTFSTLTAVPGSYLNLGSEAIEGFSGGSFSVTEGTTDILSGTFGNSLLTVSSGGSLGDQLNLDDVTYSAASTYLTGLPFSLDNGNLTIDGTVNQVDGASGTDPIPTVGSDFLSFNAYDQVQFDAVPVATTTPEPASFATFGIGALVLLSLVAVAKRRSMVNSL